MTPAEHRRIRVKWLKKVQALPHGTLSTASNWGCLCPDCARVRQEYKAAYDAKRREEKKRGA